MLSIIFKVTLISALKHHVYFNCKANRALQAFTLTLLAHNFFYEKYDIAVHKILIFILFCLI